MSEHVINIDGERFPVGRFSTYKALEAIDQLAVIGELVPQASDRVGDFMKNWSLKHGEVLPRAAAELRYGQPILETDEATGETRERPAQINAVTEAGWQAAEQTLPLPGGTPPAEAIIADVLPMVFRGARKELERLAALVITPNRKLEDADEAGHTGDLYAGEGPCAEYLKIIRHKSRPADFVAIIATAYDVAREELADVEQEGTAGELLRAIGSLSGGDRPQKKEPRSSSGSPKPSPAGRAGTSSTGSRGGNSKPRARA